MVKFLLTGRPKPQLQWWREGTLLESKNLVLFPADDPKVSTASVTVTNMTRSHFRTTYSCQAVNNNVTTPASRTVIVNMFCKLLLFVIIYRRIKFILRLVMCKKSSGVLFVVEGKKHKIIYTYKFFKF